MSGPGYAAELLKKLNVKPEDAKKAAEMLTDNEVSKGMAHATELTSGQMVSDLWEQGKLHRVPGPDMIKIGPPQESSGGGAEKMVGDYSNPAPQKGIQVEAERLAAHFHHIYGAMKAQADAINNIVDSVNKTSAQVGNLTTVAVAMLAKAEDDEKKKEKDEDSMEHCDKAHALFAKARKLLKKSKKIRVESKAAADGAKKKELKKAAVLMRKAASRCLYNAQIEALAGRGMSIDHTFETRKNISALIEANPAIKADMKFLHEDDDDKDEEKKAKKAYKKAAQPVVAPNTESDEAAKAVQGHNDAKGNQADKKDPESGNQDDSAVKAAVSEMSTKIDNALSGLGMLKTDVQGLFDAFRGRPVTGPVGEIVPLMKAVPNETPIEKIAKRIDEADESGMETSFVMRARGLLSKYDAVQKGSMHESIYNTELQNSPMAVRELFAA